MSVNQDLLTAHTIFANINNIPVLTDTNFIKWKEHVMLVLGCMDLDHSFRLDRPAPLTSESTTDQKAAFEKWDRSNRLSLMIMKLSIPESIKGSIPEEEDAKSFLKQIADRFTTNENVEIITILTKLVSMRYSGKGNVREYILEMASLVTRLKTLKLEISESILVHLVLISLPAEFTPFKISYNIQKEKWTLNELIALCAQEEERLRHETSESIHLESTYQGSSKKRKRTDNKKQDQELICFFCKKNGHMKKECTKYAKWRVKKGLSEELIIN